MKIQEIVSTYFSSTFENNLLQEISTYGILKNAEPDKIILEVRRNVEFIPLIVTGVAKVKRRDGKGNGIFLHYLSSKQTSAIALTFAVERKKSEIRIETESNVTYIAIPSEVVNSWFVKYSSWRSFYFKLNREQTSFLIEKINDIAFEKLEYRIVKYLETTSFVNNDNVVEKKHFDIARDLKVSREAVSRILEKLEKEEVVTLGRNRIILN